MPIFGKGRKERPKKKFVDKGLFRPSGGKRLRVWREWYPFTRGSKRMLSWWFPKIFGKNDFIKERFETTGRPVVVLDWGCGRGNAIAGFAKEHGPKIKAYGFSKDSYKKWLKVDNVKFIHSTAEDLFRYLKNDSVDLIYSRLGLAHLFPGFIKFKHIPEKIEHGTQYIEKLLKKLTVGGKIAFDTLSTKTKTKKEIRSALENALKGKADIEYHESAIYLTKK